MSDQPAPKTSAELRALKDQFAAEAAKKAAEISKQIEAAETAERLQKLEADFKRFTPGDDKAILKGHDFEFLINRTRDMGAGGGSAIAGTFSAVRDIFMTVRTLEDKDMTVSAKLWGEKLGSVREIDLVETSQIASVSKGTKSDEKDFSKAAQELVLGNMKETSDRKKHYVIVCDGNVASNVDHLAPIIEAATKINPRITIDFVVCNTAAGNIEGLLNKWSEVSSVQKPNLVRVASAKEVAGTIMNVVKARIAGEVYTAQELAPLTTQPAGPAKPTPSV